MALDITVKIDVVKAAGKVGMGIPLILAQNADANAEFEEVTSLPEVVSAGYAEGTDTYAAAKLIFMQNDCPAKIAVAATTGTAAEWLADEGNVSEDWRQLIVVGGESVAHNDIMAVIETLRGKMYFASLPVDDATELKVDGLERTVLFYCTDADYSCPAAALVGATAGYEAGSFTYKNIILKGIAAQKLSDGEITAIHKKGGITVVKKAGDIVTSEGKTAGGEYIDIIDSKDYVIQNIEYAGQKLLNENKKVRYDNRGIAMLKAVVKTCLQNAYTNGIIADNEDGTPAYDVVTLTRDQVSADDRRDRIYNGCSFSFALAGAIHEAPINGQILI